MAKLLHLYPKQQQKKRKLKKRKKKKKIAKKKTNNSNLSLSEEIKQLNELYKDGALTEEEFKAAKAKLLNPSDGSLIQDYNQATDLGIDFMCYNMCKDTTKGMSISQLDSFCKNQCPLN